MMKYADKMEFSNIQLYEVGDIHIENLVFKAINAGAHAIVVGPSALSIVNKFLKPGDNIKVNCAISYPSGAYLTYQKVQEIEDMLACNEHIDEFYVVMQVGMYLSGYAEEMREEFKSLVKAAGDKPIKIVTEISVLSTNQMEEICDAAINAGIKAVVISTDFKPYDVPEPTIEQVKEFVRIANGRLEVIGSGNVEEPKRFLDMINAGVDRVNTAAGFEILNELNN